MKHIVRNNAAGPIAATIALYVLLTTLALLISFNAHSKERSEVSATQASQASQVEAGCLGTFNHSFRALHSANQHDLCELTKDKVILVVNTASQCGYTGQFADLEALYQEYQHQGLVILGFPSDSFRQEHSSEAETADVCFRNFGVSFPMMATSPVTGNNANTVFKALTQATRDAPRWNFHKYLISADGQRIESFASAVNPQGTEITSAIERLLQQP